METQAVLAYSKPPIVHSSASYILAPGDKFVINEHMLRTDDNDNPPSEVVYTLTSVPNDGKLLLNGIALTIEQTFTQADINAGHVSIQASSQIEIEHFEFSVSDGTTSVPGHSFQVQTYVPPPVLPPPPASQPPIVEANFTLPVLVGDTLVLNDSMLRTVDLDTSPSDLVYTLTGLPDDGKLLLNGNPLTTGQTFTQADITAGHLSIQASGQAEIESFGFTVSDGITSVPGHSLQVQTFVPPVMPPLPITQPPFVEANVSVPVPVGDTLVLNDAMLRTVDLDTSPSGIVYTLTGLPDDGKLLFNGQPLATGQAFTQSDINAGHVSIRASGQAEIEHFGFTVSDGMTTILGQSFQVQTFILPPVVPPLPTIPPTPKPPTSPTQPTTPSETVDGVEVGRGEMTNGDGSISQVITIPVVTGERSEQVGNNSVADIPLAAIGSSGESLLTAQVPTGYGLQVTGNSAPVTAGTGLAGLIREIQAHTPAGSDDQSLLTGGGTGFLGGLAQTAPLLVQTLVPSMATGNAPTGPLVINGNPGASSPAATALVIDTTALPSGPLLELNNVEFAAVIGAATISGGAGAQRVWGDSASQTIVLGADDDVLHGGAGNDTVGSKGGDDVLFGDAGDDVVFGGEGNDRLSGGTGNDQLDGETGVDVARFETRFDQATLTWNDDGTLTVTTTATGTDTLQNVELLRFDDRVVLAQAPDLVTPQVMAFEESYYLGHNPDVAEAVARGDYANGYDHYVQYGAGEGRSTAERGAAFDEAYYLSHNPDVAAAVERGDFRSGYEHFAMYGQDEGRSVSDSRPAFDEAFYLAQNPDVAAAIAAGDLPDAFTHYSLYGQSEGRDPNALFDERWYRAENADVAAAVEQGTFDSAYEHYLAYGWEEGRDPSAWMDVEAYQAAHPDVAAAGIDPLGHFLMWGSMEGRVVSANDGDLWG
nr:MULTISPECIES: cadherin-like domain-containing protein [unclassified Halomonas]